MGHLKAEPGATTDERRKKQCIGAKHGAKEFLSLYGGRVLAGLVKNTICIELSSL
jgi:hypothetical protein